MDIIWQGECGIEILKVWYTLIVFAHLLFLFELGVSVLDVISHKTALIWRFDKKKIRIRFSYEQIFTTYINVLNG